MFGLKLTHLRLRRDIHASQDVYFLIDALFWQKVGKRAASSVL